MPEFMNAPGSPADIEHKAVAADPHSGLLAADDETGVVEAIVSVTGVKDEVNDVIVPGVHAKSLAKRTPKGIFAHDWHKWVARTEEAKELMPGDPTLPKTTRDGQPWPAEAGGLYVKARFNLETPEGQAAYSNVKFFSETGECEWSIGYKVPPGKGLRAKDGTRRITAIDVYEYSPVLFGAAPLSGTLAVKAADRSAPARDDDDLPVTDWNTDTPAGGDPTDPITAEADEDDPDMQALHEAAIREMNEDAAGWDAIDAASAISPGEEEITTDTAAALQAADQRRQGSKGHPQAERKDADGGDGSSGMNGVSDAPWSDFSPADYTPPQWHRACLIHDHPAGEIPGDKEHCKLPVREPDGTVNRSGVHAAAGVLAGARGGVHASDAQKRSAAAQLRSLYKRTGDTPPGSLQAKVLTSADVTGTPPTGPSGPAQLRAREAQAFTGHPDAYTPVQWHDATLVHMHPDGTLPASKDDCALPVATPDGALSIDGMHQAAQALAAGEPASASDGQRHDGAVALIMLFRRAGETPPDVLGTKVAGREMTPADARATERLKAWYTHGGGAAQIGWGVPGDFDRCVAIAGKHMDPAKAKGYCQLRHHAATGFYAGHAPSEEAAHGAAAAAGALAGRKGIITPDTLGWDSPAAGGGYDPALETGEYAGHLPAETKTAALAGAPLEEHVDRVTAAVTAALGGTLPGPAGMPRRLVAVHGTWPEHAIATAWDTWNTPDTGESFRVPYQLGADGILELGDPEPVTLTLTGGDAGTKDLGDGDMLSALPVLVEHVTGFIGRGLRTETKQGRVLSDANARLLRGAVDQLISVLNSAGIMIGVQADTEPDEDDRALNEATTSALYLPDSTAPAAQVAGKSLEPGMTVVDPELVAAGFRIIAEASALTAGT